MFFSFWGHTRLRFLFNVFRYVDIAEAIDSSDSITLDGSDFQDADAIPNVEILPRGHYLRSEVSRVAMIVY